MPSSSAGRCSRRTRVPRRCRQPRQLDLHRPVQSRTSRVRLLASSRPGRALVAKMHRHTPHLHKCITRTTQVLTHDSPRGGVAIVTDKSNPVTTSSLLLRHVKLSDSGKYSCTPSNADPSSVTLHVLQGNHFRDNHLVSQINQIRTFEYSINGASNLNSISFF